MRRCSREDQHALLIVATVQSVVSGTAGWRGGSQKGPGAVMFQGPRSCNVSKKQPRSFVRLPDPFRAAGHRADARSAARGNELLNGVASDGPVSGVSNQSINESFGP